MNQSQHWLKEASQLCAEIGSDDGVGLRIIARALDKQSSNRKGRQLAKETRHTISMIFSGGLSDPVFHDIEIRDVCLNEDGQFLSVTMTQTNIGIEVLEQDVLEKCQAVQGYLRFAIAETVKRKRVPAIKFKWVPMDNEGAMRCLY